MTFAQFRRTKIYDLLAAAPLIFWYGLGVYGQIPELYREKINSQLTAENLRALLHVMALLTSFAFLGLLSVLLLLRPPPVQRMAGFAPRAVAFAHAFIGVAYLWLPSAAPSLPVSILSWLLSFGGTAAAVYVAFWLGKSFSIMPEARKLVTQGPYARIRHPLYLAEAVGLFGVMLQFRQPWAALLYIATLPLLIQRMRYEERILNQNFPEFGEYAARTARLIPGLY
jgi:protein-S-isoprenylcysteine O-methyltransferase Ste14